MKNSISFLILICWINFSFSQMKDTVFGKVKSVKEELVFLNKNKQNYRLFSSDGDYGHSGFINNVATKSRFYNNWYHTAFVHYLNYYKEFDEKGNATNEIWFFKDGDTLSRYEYKFNEEDKLEQVKTYSFDDSFSVTNHSYNKYSGNLLSTIDYLSDDPESYRYTYYAYDRKKDNRLVEVNNFNDEGVSGGFKFVYDEQGRKIKKIYKDYWVHEYYNDSSSSSYLSYLGKDKLQEEYFYNQDGSLEEVWQYRNDPKDENQVELWRKTKNFHLKNGLIEYAIVTDLNDTIKSITKYKYDKKDRKIEMNSVYSIYDKLEKNIKIFDKTSIKLEGVYFAKNEYMVYKIVNYFYNNESLVKLIYDERGKKVECKFEYTFDDKNNWTEQVKYINGEKLYVWKRKINYYK